MFGRLVCYCLYNIVIYSARNETKVIKDVLCLFLFSEFEVKSKNFPGQVHRWRLTLLLQKGTERAHETLLNVCGTS